MATNNRRPVHSLVIDAGPIIKNEPAVSTLIGQAETLYTIPAVIDEIRDTVTRARVETTLLPFLTLRSPQSASIKVITDFARRTGDLEVLSKPDIHLMALAYELECERNQGDWRLRSVPGQARLNGAPPASLKNGLLLQDESPTEKLKPGQEVMQAQVSQPKAAWGTFGTTISSTNASTNDDGVMQGVAESLQATHLSQGNAVPDAIVEDTDKVYSTQESSLRLDTLESEDSDSDSDSEGWITPSNLKKQQEKDANGSTQPEEEIKVMQVALITSDFAMQNVLLRMNLNLLSLSLHKITQLKTWVLRCHACFFISKDMSKQFCGRCGKPTLMRTSCSTDKDGNFKLHLKKNMQWNTRGNVYSIPKAVAGTSNGKLVSGGGKGGWGQGLILAEDQKEYVTAMTDTRRKKEKDLMDEDYLPSILSGDRGRGGNKPKVGAGKNVNSRKRKK